MKKVILAALSGAAVFALIAQVNAQGTGTGSTSPGAASSTQCWDVSANMVRDKNAAAPSGSTTGSTSTSPSGSSTPSGTSSSSTSSGSSSAAVKPAGMPNC